MRSKSGRHLIDIHVGNRVRIRRGMLELSQSKLAEALGITFQQVQKYEKGTNRISASVLYAISGALDVEPAFFFDGLPSPRKANLSKDIVPLGQFEKFLATKDGASVVEALTQIDEGSRKMLVRHILETAAAIDKRRGSAPT